MNFLQRQCVVSIHVFKRVAHGMTAMKTAEVAEPPIFQPKNIPIITLVQPRSLPRPVNINLGIPKSVTEWQITSSNGLLNAYLQLSKHRLTTLVALTAMSGSVMVPVALDWTVIAACLAGTTLMSSSANALNQYLEAPYDAQMKRTQSRVLVIHRLSPLNAVLFAGATSLAGSIILYTGCNALTAGLGILNVLLYAGIYTPMKRRHVGCTWVGAVVGAIPPLMGYAALTGSLDVRSLVLAAVLFSWQFPHFNGLSWNLRSDYSRAGYRVMCVENERLCRTTTFRHSLLLLGFCSIAAPISQLTTVTFALSSLPVNAVLLYLSHRFCQNLDAKTSRNLFRYSLIYLPLIMLLMGISQHEGSDKIEYVSMNIG